MEKMDGKTMDIVAEDVGKLKELFPEAFTEGKVDFEALKEVLGTFVDDRDERYNFTWNGKSKARMIAQTPSTGTLRPCKEESVDWDSTQNIFIEGDNLEVLKLLQKSYHKKVKMIYIDPPYNTGKDFVYKDNFKDNIKNYKEITGQVDGEGRNLSNNPETSGRYHTDWLNMMYPRLKLARNLLKDDGVIFISIGAEELDNLLKCCNEIFGEENFIEVIPRVVKSTSFKGNFFSPSLDYVLCYARDILVAEPFSEGIIEKQFPKTETVGERVGEKYRDDTAFYLSSLDITRGSYAQRYWVDCPDGSKVIPPGKKFPPEQGDAGDGVWRWGPETYEKQKHLLVFKETTRSPLLDENGNQAKYNVYTKSYLKDREDKGKLPRNFFIDTIQNRKGTSLLKELKVPFPFPKPIELIEWFMKISSTKNDDIIMDFFAGSGTCAHAVYSQNSSDGFSRKMISVQLPEFCDEETESFKSGYKTIAEISKERIRRAAAKIKEELATTEHTENTEKEEDLLNFSETDPSVSSVSSVVKKELDLGFKVFKLDSTNIKPWEVDFDMTERTLEDFISNIKTDRREEDVLYEILLKYGLDLTLPITEHAIAGQKVFDIGLGALIICLSDAISLEVVEGIAKLKDDLNPEIMRVVFKDSGFKDDVVKTNAVQILKQAGIVDVRSL